MKLEYYIKLLPSLFKRVRCLEIGGGGQAGEVTWDSITGKPAVIASGETQVAARQSIGAGTSNLALGTTASTAAAGNHTHTQYALTTHTHPVAEITDISDVGKSVIMAPTMAGAREAIGAGTGNSNLTIGTTATTAKAGNYQPTWAEVTNKPVLFSGDYNDLTNKPTSIETVENQNTTQSNIMFWTGTQAEYDSITVPNPDTLYFIKP